MLAELQDVRDAHVQLPQVAGTFYPAAPDALRAQLGRCLLAGQRSSITSPKLIIAPHAGLVYSGGVAASAFSGLTLRQDLINRVVVIGPAHRMAFRGVALNSATSWRTPLGDIPVDIVMQQRLKPLAEVSVDDRPFAGEHSIEVLLPFLQVMLKSFQLVPVLVGEVTPAVVANVLARIWGGPETLIVVSSDLSHYMGEQAAKTHDTGTRRLIETLDAAAITADRACGHRIISGALLRAQALDMRVTATDMTTSGDVTADHARVVGYGSFAFEYGTHAQLAPGEHNVLLQTAARCLAHACQHKGKAPALSINGALPMTLSAQRATFVTLEKDKRLRGCIGSLKPYRPLLQDVVANAIKAGFADPRFAPLTLAELAGLDLSVSILSHFRPIEAATERALIEDLSPDRDGLVISDLGKSALFLPHVWAQIPDPRIFLSALRQKAGLPGDHWSPTFRAQRFSVEKFGAPVRELLKA